MSSDSSLKLDLKEEDQMDGSAEPQSGVFIEELLKTFECPICFKYMTSTIHNCLAGHSICSDCKQQGVTTCPVCRAGLSSGRNYMAEDLAKRIVFPCENKDRGCTVKVLGSEVKQHQINCPYRIYKCRMDCKWTGGRDQLTKHYTDEHPEHIHHFSCVSWSWLGSFTHKTFYDLICTYGEQFLWFGHVDPINRCLTSSVHYIGDAEKASVFTYAVIVKSEDGRRSWHYEELTKNDSSDLDTITQSTELFFANKDTYKNFADKGGKLLISVVISKAFKWL